MDARTFEQMYHAHFAALLRYGARRVGMDAAHDMVAETFLIAWRKSATIPADPLPWLYATARRVLANQLRTKARQGRLDERVAVAAERGVVVLDHAEGVAVRTDLRRALAGLSARDQEILTLAEWDGLSVEVMAKVIGCSQTATKVRLHRARRRLSALLTAQQPDALSTTGETA